METNIPKIGLALGSGGAKGLSHIGVIKTLERHKIPIDYIAGSSIGALVGALYAATKDVNYLEDLALSFNRRRGFSLFDPTIKGGILKGEKIEAFMGELFKDASFASLKIPFAAVATDYNTAEPIAISEGDIIKAVRASISVPAIFQLTVYKNRLLADGGLSNPVPVETVSDMGSDIVIGVNLDTVYVDSPVEQLPSLTKIPMHSINILRHHLALHAVKTADIVINPKVFQVGLIGWSYFFDTKKTKELIQAGVDATEKIIPQIKELISEKQRGKKTYPRFLSFFRKFYHKD